MPDAIAEFDRLKLPTADHEPVDPKLLRPQPEADGHCVVVAANGAREEIRRQAHCDYLTGLPNRCLFDQFASDAVARAHRWRRPLALLFIDLDGFKQVNELYGHDAGDHVLATFALRLRACLRRFDATARHVESSAAARLGGDEFAVLIEGFLHRSALETIAQEILAAAAKPFDLAGPTGRIGASVGIAVYPDDGIDVDTLRQSSESAVRCARQAGKNACRFSVSIEPDASAHDDPDADRRVAAG